MAKSIKDKVIDQGISLLVREVLRDVVKAARPKIQKIFGNQKRRRLDDDQEEQG